MDVHLAAKRNLTLFGIFISVALALFTVCYVLISLGVLLHADLFYFFGSMAFADICATALGDVISATVQLLQ